MNRDFLKISVAALLLCGLAAALSRGQQTEIHEQTWPTPDEGVYLVHDFHFQSGETLPEVKLHLYGKSEARAGRKMGHLTATAESAARAEARVREARSHLMR